MKKTKTIIGVVAALAVIVAILAINKKKMAANTSGGISSAYYVTVDKVKKSNLSADFKLTGVVNAYNDVNIMSETSGKVTAVYTKIGDYKSAGSVLFQVDDELKKAALLSAEANYEKSKKDYERFKELFAQKSVSDSQLEQAKLAASVAESQYIVAKRQLEDTKIKTPISGYITSRNVDVGSMVQASPSATLVANIVDISKLKVKLSVAEIDAVLLKVGDPVNVTTDVFPGVTYSGRIESISSKGDESHTYPIEIVVTNQSVHQLKAGMFARAEFTSLQNKDVLAIPRAALVGSIKDAQVYVVENDIAKLRKVVVGKDSGTLIQIIDGLHEGDTIVLNGQNNLVDNVKVEILNK